MRRPYRAPWARQTEDEAINAGRMAALLYGVGGISGVLMLLLPGVHVTNTGLVVSVAVAGLLWAAIAGLLIDWRTIPPWLTHASCGLGLPITVLVMACTGGSESPGRFFLYFVVVYAAYFYRREVAIRYLTGCAVVVALPLLYEPGAIHGGYAAELAVVIPTYFVLGLGIITGKEQLIDQSTRAERLAEEQAALRRVATAVAEGRSAHAVVAEEAAHLLGASGGSILRFSDRGDERVAAVVGAWSARADGWLAEGSSFVVAASPVLSRLSETGETVRKDVFAAEDTVAQLGYRSSITSPVRVDGQLWGAISIGSEDPAAWIDQPEARLTLFADLLATAIGNTEDREKLAAQASADPLTGLANHRTFHERLGSEVTRAQRHGRALSLAVIDVDNFKQVNDTHGHEAGDRVLAEVGRMPARRGARGGRPGPHRRRRVRLAAARERSHVGAGRARARPRADHRRRASRTISVGICDLELAADPEDLFRFADGALYWSKVNGRNTTWLYDPKVVQELSAQERAEHLERSQALIGLRALARAIDAKDVSTREHSERVAELSAELATASGWPAARVALLREAAAGPRRRQDRRPRRRPAQARSPDRGRVRGDEGPRRAVGPDRRRRAAPRAGRLGARSPRAPRRPRLSARPDRTPRSPRARRCSPWPTPGT